MAKKVTELTPNPKNKKLTKQLKRIDKIVDRVEKQIVKLHSALENLRGVQREVEKQLEQKKAA